MSVRIIIKIFLTLQLLLLIFRQMIDFAGIQWLMIIVNAIAIIITITAFFNYLMLYTVFQIFLIFYNIYVICVYARFITIGMFENNSNILSSTSNTNYFHKDILKDRFNDDGFPIDDDSIVQHTSPLLPSAQLLSFDSNSRSFWYVIVSNHISNIQSHLNHYQLSTTNTLLNRQQPQQLATTLTVADHHHHHNNHLNNNNNLNNNNDLGHHHLRHHPLDESLVDVCVQYIEIAIASLHILFSLLAIGLILLKNKLERDKFLRNNDKTTPPLPPYSINPQMNHYMSFTPTNITTTNKNGSIYSQNSVRRSSKRRRSTRSLHTQKSKSHSMGALNSIRANSSGSLRSMSKQSKHRKSATSLLMMNNNNNNHNTTIDTSFSNNTICSRSGAKSSHSNYQQQQQQYQMNTSNLYGTIQSIVPKSPMRPPQTQQLRNNNNHQFYNSPPPPPPGGPPPIQRHSVYGVIGSSIHNPTTHQHVARFLNSDSETDNYYHTFQPAYLNNGLANPLYGKRNSYLDSSETAI